MMRRPALIAFSACCAASALPAQRPSIPAPAAHIGFEVGADRKLADWREISGYFGVLAAASPAVVLDTLGTTTQGRPFLLATISSPANIRKLAEIRAAQARLADPRTLDAAEEARLVATQPVVAVIQNNLHSTEIASSQMAMELAHRLATNDTLQAALEDVVILLIPSANPDGQQMVVDWYERYLGTEWEGGPMPWLYHPYVGHDNNRDFYMVTQKETRLITDLLYRQWFPQVFYDVHQQGSYGMRLTVPPHVDPINPNVDPLIVRSINHLGAEMSLALESRGKAGVGDGVTYDLWWHGGARSTPTRHNMVGLLTEAASVRIATPMTLQPDELRGHPRGLPRYERRVNFPNPWPGGTWRLRDIVEYQLIAAEALVRTLADQRQQYVRNYVGLGRKQVRLGQTERPYSFVIPAHQHDPAAVRRLVEVLRTGGVEVERATGRVRAGSVEVDSGAFVVPMAQPYRAHAKDLLERQRFPALEQWPGGPVERPYDVAGWTLPLQMGVRVLPVDTPATIRARPVTEADLAASGRCIRLAGGSRGSILLDAGDTENYRQVMQLLRRRVAVERVPRAVPLSGGGQVAPGAFLVRGGGRTLAAGCAGEASRATGSVQGVPIRIPRVALYRPWTASMDEGWTRWVLEQFEFPHTNVTDSVIRAGRLRDRFDVLLVPDMSLRDIREGVAASRMPEPYAGGLEERGLTAIRQFVQAGGTLVLLDASSELATEVLGVPVELIRVPRRSDTGASSDSVAAGAPEQGEPLYAPGSIFRVLVDATQPVGYGMPDTAAVYFTNSMTFRVPAGSPARVVARYPVEPDSLLQSGFLQGAQSIAGHAAAVDVPLGRGRVVMFGFRPQYRGQSYGTFRMLFNALLSGGTTAPRR